MNAYDSMRKLQALSKGTSHLTQNIADSGLFTYGVTVDLGAQNSESAMVQTSTQGNSLSGGKLIMQIDQDIRFTGIRADLGELELKAKNLYVEASSSMRVSKTLSSNFNIKIPLGAYGGGMQPGLGIDARGGKEGEVVYDENYIRVSGRLKLDVSEAGIIRGVSITAGSIEGSFGSLVVESLQDIVRERMYGFGLKIGTGDSLGAQFDLAKRDGRWSNAVINNNY